MSLKKFILLFFIVMGGVGVGCKTFPFLAKDGSYIKVTSSKEWVRVGESTEILIEGWGSDGQILWDGTTVYIRAEGGEVDKDSVELKNGKAKVVFTGTTEGEGKVYVFSGSVNADPYPLIIDVGESTRVAKLILVADPYELPPDGGRVKLEATAYDSSNRLLENVGVLFTSTAGSLDSNGKLIYTNKSGKAIDYLETTTGAEVTASANNLSDTVKITIKNNLPPVANFTYSPQSPYFGEKITFDGSLSSDKDGEIVDYEWSFGDGSFGRGKIVFHKYKSDGTGDKTYIVRLKVFDNFNSSSTMTKNIKVQKNEAPIAAFEYSPTNPSFGDTITFDASSSYDNDGEIVSYEWNFGDGSFGEGKVVKHTYQYSGESSKTYTVILTVKDNSGNEDTTDKRITVVQR